MRFRFVLTLVCAVLLIGADALAQPGQGRGQGRRGGGRGFFGPGGGITRMTLLRVDKVQKELEIIEDQLQAVQAAQQELRGDRGGPGGPGPGGPGGFRDLSEEEREKLMAERRKQQEERIKKEQEKLAEILLPKQLRRLDQIFCQVQGTQALDDPQVAASLEISDEQRRKMGTARGEAMRGAREEIQQAFQSGDRDAIREKMQQIRKQADQAVMAVLSDAQKEKFKEMQGEKFELTPEELMRSLGGRGRGGPRGPGGDDRGNRPDRPRRPE